jgi:hypothetical protein
MESIRIVAQSCKRIPLHRRVSNSRQAHALEFHMQCIFDQNIGAAPETVDS